MMSDRFRESESISRSQICLTKRPFGRWWKNRKRFYAYVSARNIATSRAHGEESREKSARSVSIAERSLLPSNAAMMGVLINTPEGRESGSIYTGFQWNWALLTWVIAAMKHRNIIIRTIMGTDDWDLFTTPMKYLRKLPTHVTVDGFQADGQDAAMEKSTVSRCKTQSGCFARNGQD